MKQLPTPFYDPGESYEDNYHDGPFGGFADGEVFEQTGDPLFDYHGQKVYLPFGIAAGPLLNSNYVKAAFEKGFDICVYKTVRSDYYQPHPFPNILSVHVSGDLTLEKLKKPLLGDTHFEEPIAITNSFNVPSKRPEVWQEDMKKAIATAGKGQVMVGSFMGTVRDNQTQDEFVEDWVVAAKLVVETGAKIVEADLSCPNKGSEGLVCYDIQTTKQICKRVRAVIDNTPFILKIGYYEDEEKLKQLAEIANEYGNGIAAINTLPGIIVDKNGNQALPGELRKVAGVCGAPIKWAGLDMVKRLKRIKDENDYSFSIEGVGGVTTPEDYKEYKDAGADVVFSCTGAMWNPYLAQEIKKENTSL
jgi:dihydroorotate dehydrogenase (NAD+) catalytic subunit